jgi:hypothetical protein
MNLQLIHDAQGNDTGVFIPMDDWMLIKIYYPDIDRFNADIPEWQKQLIDKRMECIAQNPERVRPIEELFNELDSEI